MRLERPVALSCGEPAGIGPDLALSLAQVARNYPLVLLGDRTVLAERATTLGQDVQLEDWQGGEATRSKGRLSVLHVPTEVPVNAGQLDNRNARHVLQLLETGSDGCQDERFSALVTAPLHKGVINEAGIPFSGHTEFLAERCGSKQPVMMLACPGLRVALVTTHLPLRAVAEAVTRDRLESVLRVLHRDLQRLFAIKQPRILVCGLNPHAGEGGHLGREEIEIIEPLLAELREEGMQLIGPLPADTAFTPKTLSQGDAVLAMYHDQGLPTLKHKGFGQAVNLTLGLPIIRTSVDHGTALDLAGSGKADAGSLHAAIELAVTLAENQA
jgi:4-hydroxythreonine-4-phosphate dehydrogenase